AILGQRHAQLDEALLYRVTVVDCNRRAAEPGQQAAEFRTVRGEIEVLVAVLGAEVHAQPVAREGHLDSVFPQVPGQVRVHDALRDRSICRARGVQGRELVGAHSAGCKDVPRHARWTTDADRIAGRAGNLQCVVDRGEVQGVAVRIEQRCVVVLPVGVVIPGPGNLTRQPDDRAVVGVFPEADAVATLDVTTPDVDIRAR